MTRGGGGARFVMRTVQACLAAAARFVRPSLVRRFVAVAAGALLAGAAACARPAPAAPAEPPLFERLTPAATGIAFANTPAETPGFNISNYLYFYNGGGVAVGDVDGDGLEDLYFSANTGPNRLYRNKGHLQFEDVTDRAGVAGPPGWKTGVTMADVNGDGRPDIYVSAVDYLTMHGHNVLYVNNGDGTFTDRTHEYGLDYDGYATQAVFFDYDGDGDLDLYLQSHSTTSERAITSAARRTVRNPRTGGRLFRNDGTPGHPHFTDVSAQAGIYASGDGFGLGVVASDLDGDGWPDLYVANDFQENDYLYHNNGDGTFTESIASATAHTSRFAMGVDAADVNDDGRPDLFVADMFPEREAVLKSSASYEGWNLFNARIRAGYHPQYARNTLQLNRGMGRFSDVAQLAGVNATDWSWAPLFADFDDDGRKDLFVTNGIFRRPNDLDYINYLGNETVQAALARGDSAALREILGHMPQVPLPNHLFRNEGGLKFADKAAAWGLGDAGFSNGAAYVDLDNDGALDLVVNRFGAPAAVYHNLARARTKHGWLTVVLRGDAPNTGGIGATVYATRRGTTQMLEASPTRGFESSVDPRLHFGLGDAARLDSLRVVWPDRRTQLLTNVPGNRLLTLVQADATARLPRPARTSDAVPNASPNTSPYADLAPRLGVAVRHVEDVYSDYDAEPLIPHMVSAEGPALAVADVNGDGLDDVFVGGAKWQPATLLLQQRDGIFRASPQPAIAADSVAEDVDAAFFDADGDGKPDLYVASGGNEFSGDAPELRGRLYLNDGRGSFRAAPDALPNTGTTASCVVPADFDHDGHVDLFVGARVVARRYGQSPASRLLHNDGRGHLVDVTRERAPGLLDGGMVTAAAWADVDGDGRVDLVTVGEWAPVRVYFQTPTGRFDERAAATGLAGNDGWWSSVTVADVNGDGHPDLVLGNLGLNSYLKGTAERPARMYLGDFAHNGTLQQVVTRYNGETSYPLLGRDELVRLNPPLRAKFPSYTAFGASTITDIFPKADLDAARVLQARTFASAVAINDGRGHFMLRDLPVEAQIAPVRAAVAQDLDGDGRVDLLLGGNDYGFAPLLGRYDAGYGLVLRGTGNGAFATVDMAVSGLAIPGQVRHMAVVRGADGGRMLAVARNDAPLMLLRLPAAARRPVVVASTARR